MRIYKSQGGSQSLHFFRAFQVSPEKARRLVRRVAIPSLFQGISRIKNLIKEVSDGKESQSLHFFRAFQESVIGITSSSPLRASRNPFTFLGHFKFQHLSLTSCKMSVAIPSLFQGISRAPTYNSLKQLVFIFKQKVIPLSSKGFSILGRFTLFEGIPYLIFKDLLFTDYIPDQSCCVKWQSVKHLQKWQTAFNKISP